MMLFLNFIFGIFLVLLIALLVLGIPRSNALQRCLHCVDEDLSMKRLSVLPQIVHWNSQNKILFLTLSRKYPAVILSLNQGGVLFWY